MHRVSVINKANHYNYHLHDNKKNSTFFNQLLKLSIFIKLKEIDRYFRTAWANFRAEYLQSNNHHQSLHSGPHSSCETSQK